jgi:hypothetical protein
MRLTNRFPTPTGSGAGGVCAGGPATIGFNTREEEAGEDETPTETPRRKRSGAKEFDSTAKLKWTSQDQKFLRALKIAIDDESR